jgi:hypothetical protein
MALLLRERGSQLRFAGLGQPALNDPLNTAFFHQRHTVGGSGIKHQAALFRTQEARLRLGMFAPTPAAA